MTDHILNAGTAHIGPHPTNIAEQMTDQPDLEVGLLIGYNCPAAFMPLQTMSGQPGEPYAYSAYSV